jgi:hypothetical protein
MKRSILIILSIICLVLPTVTSAEEGSAGLAFLKLGVGARAIGMGDAYTAVDGDASSIYWNPAGIIDVENVDVTLMHTEWFQGIRYEYVGGVRSYGDYAIGAGVAGLYMDDLERREGPTAEPIGHFGVFDFVVSAREDRRQDRHGRCGRPRRALSHPRVRRSFGCDRPGEPWPADEVHRGAV